MIALICRDYGDGLNYIWKHNYDKTEIVVINNSNDGSGILSTILDGIIVLDWNNQRAVTNCVRVLRTNQLS